MTEIKRKMSGEKVEYHQRRGAGEWVRRENEKVLCVYVRWGVWRGGEVEKLHPPHRLHLVSSFERRFSLIFPPVYFFLLATQFFSPLCDHGVFYRKNK